ncbi:MAG TPA: pilus assembly protein N-terminal domain-containing protein [Bryobacteraceae bacterium]|jgi:pilus assembly protein CpaC|nr:pilus assembly protein N-terminal domain-containing protein [Bryobacteraceae bacterium]
MRFRAAAGLSVGLYAVLCLVAADAPVRPINLTVGKGELLQFEHDIVKVVIAEPKISDAIVVSPREVMINAKGAGHTTLVIWETGAAPARYEITVFADTSERDLWRQALDTELRAAFAETSGATVQFSGNTENLVLTGKVESADQSKRAEAIAATHSKKVVNLLTVPPPAELRQILLQVKFASVDRVALNQVGFNMFSTNGKTIGATSTGQFQPPRFSPLQLQGSDFNGTNVNFADLLNLFVFRPDLNIGATIKALQQENLLQILAEPNLIVVEGSEANFLAGGEFPFPTITSTTTGGSASPVVTVQFKKFGIQLNFTPTLTPAGAINLKVKPEVSSLDFANAVTLQGFLIPAISSRKAETEVVLRDGESFAIAGLIDNRVTRSLSKVRGIGDIPILGQLFRSRSTQKSNDELLVVVTPRFVKPLAPNDPARLPDMVTTFLPTVAEQKSAKGKKKADTKKQETGPRGHQIPN